MPVETLSERLFAELVLTALAAERRLRPYVGELGADPMLFRGFGTFGRWQEIPHPSRFVRERSEDGDRVGELYTRMIETDANMAALWEKRVKAVLALPRYIRAADSTPLSEETARFVQTALSLIPVRIVPVSNILEAVIKGVAINEILWEQRPAAPWPAHGFRSISSTGPCGASAGPRWTDPFTSLPTRAALLPSPRRR